MWTRRAARYAAVLAVAGGVAIATTTPASAATPNTAVGIQAAGILPLGPLVVSTFPGTSPVILTGVDLPPLLTVGAVGAETGPTTAHAAVAGLSVSLPTLASVTVGAVESSCAYDPSTGDVTGETDVANGTIKLLGIETVLEADPAPNTTVTLPAGLGSLTLNQQTVEADGTLAVNAIAIDLLGLEHIVIARSVCNDAP
ncbi:hypothetical protein [Parafrankia sp. FMc2]|uniref:hypothetical protein n=1 Tax=Parafrankia sp. FMc2 TaxID=3233196 RepID=UPI0034D59757